MQKTPGTRDYRTTLRDLFVRITDPIIRLLILIGIKPWMVTIIGMFMVIPAAFLIATERLIAGGVLFLFASGLDLFDGTIARKTNSASKRGALLDSTADRISESILLGGVFLYGLSVENDQILIFSFVAVIGSILVSYIRARAEGLGIKMDEGWFTRPERVVLMGLSCIFNLVLMGVILLSILTIATALQRWKLADSKLEIGE